MSAPAAAAPAAALADARRALAAPDRLRRALLCAPAALAAVLAGCVTPPRRELPQAVAPFSTLRALDGLPPGWEELVMRRDLPRTDYRVVTLDGRRVLRASGHGASGLRCRLRVDPHAAPWLRWSWRTREVPLSMCVDRSETDDSPARVAVAFDGDEQRLSMRDRALYELVQLITGERLAYATLMYVWDGQLPVGATANYARTARIRYLVVESGSARAGRWLRYERDIVADFRRLFAEEPGPVNSVGVLTDADDLRLDLETWYGDIRMEPA
ncbi:DUF3047 domain-containing protein [Ramlibacter sp.]|uniref:DUF3047 domain-containing protein n=1 Tax=Ramlibacter sp. TaxID=1917967 RepID=UPI002C265AD9|nr:DUF3047 domain-containing protein [Ramlibacter sp.]HWI81916.1 DUF3047 domain-containing protein [Ramlibacter sp.]